MPHVPTMAGTVAFAIASFVALTGVQLVAADAVTATLPAGTAAPAAAKFHAEIEPLLQKYCYDCHGDGAHKGRVTFDDFDSDADLLGHRDLWLKALKNVRAGLMPPREEDDSTLRPNAAEIEQLARWVKYGAFGIDPADPDPGHVTARRLNRIEYHNTIRDLMGVDFDSEVEFPPDDTGGGFDNNGAILTLSPLLLEKYLTAAQTIVEKSVPRVSRVMRERIATGREFRGKDGRTGEQLSARRRAQVAHTFRTDRVGTYQLAIELEARGSFDFDPSHCTVTCLVDGKQEFTEDIVWRERHAIHHDYEFHWGPGEHVVAFDVKPIEPPATTTAVDTGADVGNTTNTARRGGGLGEKSSRADAERPHIGPNGTQTRVDVRITSVHLRGPIEPSAWTAPENYARFFPKGPAPTDPAARDRYAAEIMGQFATRAYRRPVDQATVTRLVGIARSVYAEAGRTFEEGIRHAMMGVLASPRFLYRVEEPARTTVPVGVALKTAALPAGKYPEIDEYALASRLSYFLWSTMPDEELFGLARRGELRANLHAQVARMLKDDRSQAFIRNFTGQWLQARDIEFVPLNPRSIFGYNAPSALRNKEGRLDFDSTIRKMMRSETEMYVSYVVREDRSVLELIDSNYTFLNEKLAALYGVPGVTGEELHRIELPADSVRGGVLTQSAVLAVTSNPTRTSPVKRGLFVLENFLGTPPPPPPMAVPALEDAKRFVNGHEPKLSEMLAIHRADKLCSSCHQRMDPLGLAFENFNALGVWRDKEAGEPIEPAGQLVTGEKFSNVRELKHVLTHERREDVYRCVTEKLLTYALGRGLDYYDVETVDVIVARLDRDEGRMSALLYGVIDSAPFQKMRAPAADTLAENGRTR